MPLNVTPRQYRIWICRPGQDETTGLEVTGLCSGDSGGFLTVTVEPFDESGLIAVTGRLVLDVPTLATTVEGRIHQYADPLYDPWVTPAQWRAGNRVLIQIADSSGTLRRLPFALLYLIGEPMPPYPGNWQLTLELGNKFRLLDAARPRVVYDPEGPVAVAGATPEGPITASRARTIDALLAGTGLEMGFTIGGPGLVDYERDWNSPAVAQVGEIAMGGFCALWLDPDDVIQPAWLGTLPERRLFKHVVGVDDAADFEPIQNPIRPATSVQVVSPQSAVPDQEGEQPDPNDPRNNPDYDRGENGDEQKYSGQTVTEEFGTIGSVDGTDNATEVRVAVRRESWGWSGSQYRAEVLETRCRGMVIPQDLYDLLESQGRNIVAPSPLSPINALLSQEVRIYEGSDEGRLLSIRKTSYRPRGEVLAEWYKRNLLPNTSLPGFGDPIEAEVMVTRYRYQTTGGKDSKGQVREIRTTIYRPRGQLAAGANDWTVQGVAGPITQVGSTDLAVAETKLERWRKRSADEWEYSIRHRRAGQARNGTIKGFLALRTVESRTVSSRNGDIQPPAADRRPGSERPRRERLWSYRTGRFSLGEDDEAPRDRQVILNHVASARDAVTLAELLLKFDQIRHRGYRITGKWRDEWWSWRPLARIDVQLGPTTYWGVVDALTLALSANQVVVVADCMKSGRHPDGDSYPHPPLPALTPTSPTPDPLLGSPLPDQANRQPVLPTVAGRYPFEVRSRRSADWRVFGWALGEIAGGTLVFGARRRVEFLEPFEIVAGRTIEIEQVPLLIVQSSRRLFVTELGAEQPFADWPLTADPWTDEAGERDLAPVGTAPQIGADGEGNYTEFFWLDEVSGFETDGYLESAPAQWTRTPTADFSWRISLELWFAAGSSFNGFQVRVPEEWVLQINPTSLALSIRNDLFSTIGNISVDSLVDPGFALPPDAWHTIGGRFDAENGEMYVSLNGVEYGPVSLSGATAAVADSAFALGADTPPRTCRVKNVKFYRSNPVERP